MQPEFLKVIHNLIWKTAAHMSAAAGWVGREAILMTGINSLIYVLSTIPP